MCGIAGIVARDPVRVVEAPRLRRMIDVQRHRGPDGDGIWIDGPVGFGHRRLAIIDVAGGAQPMANEDESVWITYNGEIYNHVELRARLEARGHRYRTRTDTETILHLYEEHGERCVERLQGMFAFAIWDRRRRTLLLARDRLGIKPLYYAVTDRGLLFASEIKGILAAGAVPPRFNQHVLPEYLASGFVSGGETFYEGIHALQPGRTLSWSGASGLRERRYWTLPPTVETPRHSRRTHAHRLRARLAETVTRHLMADVPLGLFLSGGLDSSGLAALAAAATPAPIRTFSVGFDDPAANELDYARSVARAIGSDHHEVVVSPDRFFDALPRLIWHEDEPIAFPSSVPLYFVSDLARRHVKVVLTGEGADELFGGYNRYRVTALNERLGSAYGRVVPPAVRSGVARLVRGLPGPPGRLGSRTFLARPLDPRALCFETFSVFADDTRRALLGGGPGDDDAHRERTRSFAAAPGGVVTRLSRVDLETYLVELLMKQDQMSMAASIESRVPFLDHELVEETVRLPDSWKVRGWQTKVVLREALREVVPAAILARPKMGFPVPISAWFRGSHTALLDEFVAGPRVRARGVFAPAVLERLVAEHRAGRADHGHRLWLLINLEIWLRTAIDGEDRATVLQPAARRPRAA